MQANYREPTVPTMYKFREKKFYCSSHLDWDAYFTT